MGLPLATLWGESPGIKTGCGRSLRAGCSLSRPPVHRAAVPTRDPIPEAVRCHYVSYVPHRCLVLYFITFKSECQQCPLSKVHTTQILAAGRPLRPPSFCPFPVKHLARQLGCLLACCFSPSLLAASHLWSSSMVSGLYRHSVFFFMV